MKERPILFSGSMVRAILEGRKNQTRRVVKVPPWLVKMSPSLLCAFPDRALGVTPCLQVPCADGSVQRLRNPWVFPEPSRLWVRETWRAATGTGIMFKADGVEGMLKHYPKENPSNFGLFKWRPSIFMRREYSRITLGIVNVRVEQLQEITQQDIAAEGFRAYSANARLQEIARDDFGKGWDTINGKRKGCTWSDNPWVWVVEFQER